MKNGMSRSGLRRSRLIVVALALAASLTVGLPAAGAGAATAPGEGRARAAVLRGQVPDGPYAVGVRRFTLVDPSRPTAANGTAPALPSRTLETVVFHPAAGTPGAADQPDAPVLRGAGRFPLLVFNHGFTGTGPGYSSLLRRIAAAGYVVAAPTFPLSSAGAPGGPNIVDVLNQPADVRFVIDELLRLDRDRASGLRSSLRRSRIGVAGHSLGAVTSLGLLNDCCADRRVDALVPIAGLEIPYPGTYYGDDVPVLLVHGDADPVVPFAGSVGVYGRAQPPKYLLSLLGAGHSPFGGEEGEVLVEATIAFLDRYLKDRRPALDRLRADADVPGVATLVEVGR